MLPLQEAVPAVVVLAEGLSPAVAEVAVDTGVKYKPIDLIHDTLMKIC